MCEKAPIIRRIMENNFSKIKNNSIFAHQFKKPGWRNW